MAGPNSDRLKLFISYSRRDMATADALVEKLEAEGFEVTIDRRDLPYGEEWQAELGDFIRAADTVLWLVSPASVESRWCNWELGEVQRLNKRLVPVRIEAIQPDDLPENLGRIHILPAEGVFDAPTHLPILVEALNTDRTWLKEHTRLGDRARQWQAKNQKGDLLLRGSALNDAESWRDRQPKAAPQPSDDILDLILASRRAHGRRQRITVAGSLAVALVAIALSGVALWQRNEAQEQTRIAEAARQQAQNALYEATQTADGIVFNLAQQFGHLGIPTSVRADILGQARELQDALAEHAADNLVLQRSRAAALSALGDTFSQSGDSQDALEVYQEALAIMRDVVARVPYDAGWQRDVFAALMGVGEAQLRLGDTNGALAAYEEGLAIARDLRERNPDNALFRSDVATAISRIGDIRLRAGDAQGALQAYEEGLLIRRNLTQAFPEDLQWQERVAGSLSNVGIAYFRATGDPRGTLRAYEQSLAIRRDLAARDPNNTWWRRDLSATLADIGDTRLHDDDVDGALEAYQESLAISRDLAEDDPDNMEYQFNVSLVLTRIGDSLLRARNTEGGQEAYEEGFAIARSLLAGDPKNALLLGHTATVLTRIGSVRLQAGDAQGALKAYEDALAIQRDLAERDAERTKWRTDVVVSLYELSAVTEGAERRAHLEEALAITERLAEAGLLTADQQSWPNELRAALAEATADHETAETE